MQKLTSYLFTKMKYFKSATVIFVLALLVTVLTFNKDRTLKYDARGYYAFLPALLIHDGIDSSFVAEQANTAQTVNNSYIHYNEKEKAYNKYYPGVAVLQIPSFLVAHFLAPIFNYNQSGYSTIYLFMAKLFALIYLFVGFRIAYLFLTQFYTNSKKLTLLTLTLFSIGTPLLYYSIYYPLYSHGYSFFLISGFFYAIKSYSRNTKLKEIVVASILLGLIILTRPVNALVIFALPLICGELSTLKHLLSNLFIKKVKHLLISLLVFTMVLSILFVINYLQTKSLLNWSYQGEGFNFSSPQFFETFFGYSTGLFTHLPLLIISVIGLLITKNKFFALSWILYFLIISYIISSWWCWDYGGMGYRVYIEHLLLFMIPFTQTLKKIERKKIFYLVPIVFCLFTASRFVQIQQGVASARFNENTFWKSIAKFGKKHQGNYIFSKECKPYGEPVKSYQFSEKEGYFDKNIEFGFEENIILKEEIGSTFYYLTLNVEKKLAQDSDFKDVFLVMTGSNSVNNKTIYQTYPLYEYYKEGSKKSYQLSLGEHFNIENSDVDKLKFYVWNKGKKTFTLKHFNLKLDEY